MEKYRPLVIRDAILTPKHMLRPCRDCDLSPDSCDQQTVKTVEGYNSKVFCTKENRPVRREEKLIRLDRISFGGNNDLNGELKTNREVFAGEAAGL